MGVNWKSLDAKDRLLAALVAAHPDKKLLDYRRIATYYGEGTTYDSIEGQFRIIRKEAQKLREAVESGEHAEAPPRGTAAATPRAKTTSTATPKSKTSTVKKTKPTLEPSHSVISGRVVKSASPPKARKTAPTPAANYDNNNNNNQIFGMMEEPFSSSGSSINGFDDGGFGFSGDFGSLGEEDWTVPSHL